MEECVNQPFSLRHREQWRLHCTSDERRVDEYSTPQWVAWQSQGWHIFINETALASYTEWVDWCRHENFSSLTGDCSYPQHVQMYRLTHIQHDISIPQEKSSIRTHRPLKNTTTWAVHFSRVLYSFLKYNDGFKCMGFERCTLFHVQGASWGNAENPWYIKEQPAGWV